MTSVSPLLKTTFMLFSSMSLDFELEPCQLVIMAANMDHIVIDQEGDMTVAQPDAVGGIDRTG
jgi:hypothetical protein